MAIVVEEQKRSSPLFAIVGWIVFLGVILAAGYYLFLAPVTAVPIATSGALAAISPLTQSGIQPQTVEADPVLTTLHTTIPAPTSTGPVPVGRPNPFIAP